MSIDKEFEALEIGVSKLKKLYENSAKKMSKNDILGFDLTFVYLDKALTELKQIKESDPSEAMECVEDLIFNFSVDEYVDRYDKNLVTIKNYIFNTQEQEEALRLVSQHLSFEDGGTAIIKDFINDKEETKHIIKVVSKDTGATITILLDTKEEFELLNHYFEKNIQKQ